MHIRRCVGMVLRRIRGGMINESRKAVLKAMREKAEEVFTELKNCPIWMFRLVKELKTDGKEVDRGSDGKL